MMLLDFWPCDVEIHHLSRTFYHSMKYILISTITLYTYRCTLVASIAHSETGHTIIGALISSTGNPRTTPR